MIQTPSVSDHDSPAALSMPPLVSKIEDTAPSVLPTYQTAVSLNTGARRHKEKQKADEGKIQITRMNWQNCGDFSHPLEMACAPYSHGVFARFVESIASTETRRCQLTCLIYSIPTTHWLDNGFDKQMDFDLRVLDEYFASSGAGSDPYTTFFPEGKVSGFARDSVGRISETDPGVDDSGFEYFQQRNSPALSAPQPSPSPSHTEPDKPIAGDKNGYIAPRTMNLNLDERNVLPGNSKRQCTRSSHSADADSVAALRPVKRGGCDHACKHWIDFEVSYA
ncbi:hypothetical protein K438DRAFT_1757856 [Mycena galopus ATCC 62051]|nr:hypothetical protein K438DRAFT_1757856 [Mycena galopus ATCC 62051]